jgi:hypothetical protein
MLSVPRGRAMRVNPKFAFGPQAVNLPGFPAQQDANRVPSYSAGVR